MDNSCSATAQLTVQTDTGKPVPIFRKVSLFLSHFEKEKKIS